MSQGNTKVLAFKGKHRIRAKIVMNSVIEQGKNIICSGSQLSKAKKKEAKCKSSGNACYRSVQNLLSSRLLSKNIKIRIYKSIILPVVLYGCETWSLTLRGT
jgi:hypothetical protein